MNTTEDYGYWKLGAVACGVGTLASGASLVIGFAGLASILHEAAVEVNMGVDADAITTPLDQAGPTFFWMVENSPMLGEICILGLIICLAVAYFRVPGLGRQV